MKKVVALLLMIITLAIVSCALNDSMIDNEQELFKEQQRIERITIIVQSELELTTSPEKIKELKQWLADNHSGVYAKTSGVVCSGDGVNPGWTIQIVDGYNGFFYLQIVNPSGEVVQSDIVHFITVPAYCAAFLLP